MAIQKVGVVGCGLMGSGIAQTAAQAGFSVVVREVTDDLLKKGLASIEKNLNRLVEKGTLSAADREAVMGRLKGTTDVNDFKDCDIVIEAIIEQLEPKKELYAQLDRICPKTTIFASNTSSLSITEMGTSTKRPDRFIGLHFFNPVPIMKLVEVVRTIATDQAAYEEAVSVAAKLGQTPGRTRDRPYPAGVDPLRGQPRPQAATELVVAAAADHPYRRAQPGGGHRLVGPLTAGTDHGPARRQHCLARRRQVRHDHRDIGVEAAQHGHPGTLFHVCLPPGTVAGPSGRSARGAPVRDRAPDLATAPGRIAFAGCPGHVPVRPDQHGRRQPGGTAGIANAPDVGRQAMTERIASK